MFEELPAPFREPDTPWVKGAYRSLSDNELKSIFDSVAGELDIYEANRGAEKRRDGRADEIEISSMDEEESDSAYRRFARRRAGVLFDGISAKDLARPNTNVFGQTISDNDVAPFKLKQSHFLNKAARHANPNPTPTASGFAQWLYSIYADARGNEEDKERGLAFEQDVIELRRQAVTCNDDAYLQAFRPDWRLIHNGLHLRESDRIDLFNIPTLSVGGRNVLCSPDLIYKNTHTSDIIIVEIKNSRQPLPPNLWPNIWGQLWCYSQIPMIKSAPKVTVIGEVWGDYFSKKRYHKDYETKRRYTSGGKRHTSLRISVRRNPREPGFHRFFARLFEIYSTGLSADRFLTLLKP